LANLDELDLSNFEYLGGGENQSAPNELDLSQLDLVSTPGAKGIAQDIVSQGKKVPGMGWEGIKGAGKLLQYVLTPPSMHGEEFIPKSTSFMNVPKIAGAGLRKGVDILGNVPGNIRDYLAQKFPEHLGNLPSFRAHEEMISSPERDYLSEMGAEISTPQEQLVYEIAKRLLPFGVTRNPILGEATTAIGEDQDPLARALTATAFKEMGRPSTKVTGAARDVALKPFKATGKGIGKIRETAKQVKKDYLDLKNIEKEITSDKNLSAELKSKKLGSERAIAKAFDDYIPESKDKIKSNLGSEVRSFHNELLDEGKAKFNEFEKSKYGQKRVFDPITAEFVEKQYKFPEGALSKKTREMMKDTFGTYKVSQKRSPYTHEWISDVEKTPGNRTVAQYEKLWRHLRDEALHLQKELKSPTANLTYGEKLDKGAQAKALNNLASDVKNKMLKSLPEKGQKVFQENQTFWDENIRPFREESFLRNAIERKPDITTKSFLDKFSQKGAYPLKEKALQKESLKDAIIKHDMSYKKIKSSTDLENLLRDDIASYLPKETRAKALNLMEKWKSEDAMIKDIKLQLEKKGLKKSEIETRMKDIKSLMFKKGGKGMAMALGLKWALGRGEE